MVRPGMLLLAAAVGLSGQDREGRKPPRLERPAAWSAAARNRLAEAKLALQEARKSHRARLDETRAEGSHRKPR